MKTYFNNLRVAFLALAVIGALASCKKNDEVKPTDDAPAFVDKRWKLTSFELTPPIDLDGDGDVDSDLMPYLDECAKDDVVIFKRDGKMAGDQGSLHCDDDTSDDVPGTWTYDKNTKILRISGNESTNDLDELEIIEMSSNMLKAKVESTEEGVTITAVMTWKAS